MTCTAAASPGWAQPTTAPFWDYRCPSPGTELEGSDGNRMRYLGTAPEAPALCLVEGLGPRLLGLPAAARDWESLKPAQLTRMFETGQGGGVSASRRAPEGCRRGLGLDSEYISSGIDGLTVPALGFDVVVLRHDRSRYECGDLAEFERTTIWLDRIRFVPLRISIHRGYPPDAPGGRPHETTVEWVATAIAPPP